MKRQLTIAATAFLSVAALQAQYSFDPALSIVDATRFGSTNISGTARYRSMAGAFGALGGDPSCMNDNPAGLAIYRGTNLFSFTPNLTQADTHSKGSQSMNSNYSNASMSNMSAIFSFRTPTSDNLVNFTMGIGFERKYQKQTTYDIALDQCEGSFSQYLTNQANYYLDGKVSAQDAFSFENLSKSQAQYLSRMAWDCYAVEEYPDNHKVVRDPIFDEPYSTTRRTTPNDEAEVYQRLHVRETTRLDQYSISGAFNFNDMFYIGATLNISDFSSILQSNFDEYYSPDFNKSYIKYDNWYETKGSGIGLNVGLLWMPIDNWRIGAAIHTPTWNDFEDSYDGSMTTDDERLSDWSDPWSTLGSYWQYCFNTPWEYQLSTAYIIGTRGLISVEYDMRDFSSLRYKQSDRYSLTTGYLDDINTAVEDYLQMQHTIKVGGEYRINRQWSARAGYAFVTSPYKENARRGWLYTENSDGSIYNGDVNWNNYSDKEYTNIQNLLYYSTTKPNYQTEGNQYYLTCGAGWRGKQWYIDAAFMFHKTGLTACAYPDDFGYAEPVDVDLKEKSFDVTIGYKF